MAEKMKMNKQLEAPLLQVPVEKNKKIPAVLFVSVWGLTNAAIVALNLAVVYIKCIYTNAGDLPLKSTDAKEGKAYALLFGFVWCSVLQAAGGTLALLLASHRRRTRRALAYVMLAAAVAAHCMYASMVAIVLTAGEQGFFYKIITSAATLVFAIVDLLGFLSLLEGSEE